MLNIYQDTDSKAKVVLRVPDPSPEKNNTYIYCKKNIVLMIYDFGVTNEL